MPPEIGDVAATPAHRERTSEALRTLLRWPRAEVVHGWLLGGLAAGWLVWPTVGVLAVLMLVADRFDALDFTTLALVGINLSLLFPLRLAVLTTRRRAFELVSARFAPAPPVGPGQPTRCRSCGAPLPSRADDTPIVLGCGHCDTDHVLGLGLVREAIDQRRAAEHLAPLAEARVAALRVQRRRMWTTMVLAVLTPVVVWDLVARLAG